MCTNKQPYLAGVSRRFNTHVLDGRGVVQLTTTNCLKAVTHLLWFFKSSYMHGELVHEPLCLQKGRKE